MRYAEQMTPGSDARDLKGAQLGRRRFRRKSKPVTVTNSEGVEVSPGREQPVQWDTVCTIRAAAYITRAGSNGDAKLEQANVTSGCLTNS